MQLYPAMEFIIYYLRFIINTVTSYAFHCLTHCACRSQERITPQTNLKSNTNIQATDSYKSEMVDYTYQGNMCIPIWVSPTFELIWLLEHWMKTLALLHTDQRVGPYCSGPINRQQPAFLGLQLVCYEIVCLLY